MLLSSSSSSWSLLHESLTYILDVSLLHLQDKLSVELEMYGGVSKSFRTDRLEGELQMVQLSATRCIYVYVLWVSLVSFAAITLCVVASQRVFIVVYFVKDSVRELLDTPSYSPLCIARWHRNPWTSTTGTQEYERHADRKWLQVFTCRKLFCFDLAVVVSNGPNWVGAPRPTPEDGNRSGFRNVVF
jgi:hypothetical protein